MAVSKMKKFRLLGYLSLKETVVDALRELGVVHITDLKTHILGSEDSDLIEDMEIKDPLLEEQLAKLQSMLDFFSNYQEKSTLLESFLSPKLVVSEEEFKAVAAKFDVDEMYRRCRNLEDSIKKVEADRAKKTALLEELRPWQTLEVPLKELCDTDKVQILLAIVRSSFFHIFRQELHRVTTAVEIQMINETKEFTYVLLLFPKDLETDIVEALKKRDVRSVRFEALPDTPKEAIIRLESEIEELDAALVTLEAEGRELAKRKDQVLILYDYVSELLQKKQVQNNFVHTSGTFMIEGWIRQRDEKMVRQRLSKISPEIELSTSPPGRDEKPPIDLENNRVVSPFEFVTTLYGRPDYREYDPTPLLTPFFVVFFALCLTDGGYGLTLSALAFLGMKKFKGGEGADKLFRLMFFGGIVTAVVGFFTGGWFGIEPVHFPPLLRKAMLINPLENPIGMLKLAFALGIIQILFGISIRMYRNIQEGRYVTALLDQGLWLIFLICLVPLGYSFILGGKVSPNILSIAKKGALYGVIALVLTQGRNQKNIALKLVMGMAKLYDIVGYFGDVLSYARLLALGLATSAIALAINGIAKMALSMPFYVGYVVALFVLVGGHLFNLAVNSLGGFVHSGRLQYLEFFSKFFQGGGSEFRPFREEKKYTVVRKS